jgi:helix-turn-helix protein
MLAVWDCDLPHPEKCVLAAMAYNGDDNGQNIWPSISTIARRAGYKPRQVHNIIARLKSRGILRVDGRKGRQRGFVSVYSIHLAGVPLLPNPESLQSLHTMTAEQAVTSALPGESVQSEPDSLQNPHDSMQSTTGKSAIASAEERYLNRKEKKRTVAPEFSISKSQDQNQPQDQPQFSARDVMGSLSTVVGSKVRKSPLHDDDAYRERMAEVKAQEEQARGIAERYKQEGGLR